MAGDMKVYDADQVIVSFAGIPIKGYGDGEFCRIENTTEAFTSVVGTDGDVTRSKTNDRRTKVTLVLMQSSETNVLLSALHNIDLEAPQGAGVGALSINEIFGTSKYFAEKAWIIKAPDKTYDRGAVAVEWELECAELRRTDGGN